MGAVFKNTLAFWAKNAPFLLTSERAGAKMGEICSGAGTFPSLLPDRTDTLQSPSQLLL